MLSKAGELLSDNSVRDETTNDYFVSDHNRQALQTANYFIHDKDSPNLMYLQGNYGDGKTTLIHHVCKNFAKHNTSGVIYSRRGEEHLSDTAVKNLRMNIISKSMQETDLVILEDFQLFPQTSYIQAHLCGYIKYRLKNNKKTIFSSNVAISEIDDLSLEFISLINSGLSAVIHIPNESERYEFAKFKAQGYGLRATEPELKSLAHTSGSFRIVSDGLYRLKAMQGPSDNGLV